jgi:hypothetical protein
MPGCLKIDREEFVMSSVDKDVDAAIQALQAVKLFSNAYAGSETAAIGIGAVADALDFRKPENVGPIRAGVAAAIRANQGIKI